MKYIFVGGDKNHMNKTMEVENLTFDYLFNSINLKVKNDKRKISYFGIFMDMYNIKINEIVKYLHKNNIELDEWNIDFIKNNINIIRNKFVNTFCNENDLAWENELNEKMSLAVKEYRAEFDSIDEIGESLEKYEQYYDIICEMFDETYNFIENEFEKYNHSRTIIKEKINIALYDDEKESYKPVISINYKCVDEGGELAA